MPTPTLLVTSIFSAAAGAQTLIVMGSSDLSPLILGSVCGCTVLRTQLGAADIRYVIEHLGHGFPFAGSLEASCSPHDTLPYRAGSALHQSQMMSSV
jgi:hypothetical protein